jgi:hypothetical protein
LDRWWVAFSPLSQVRCAELHSFAAKLCPTVERIVENFGRATPVAEAVNKSQDEKGNLSYLANI